MQILQKLKTARKVLFRHGVSDVLILTATRVQEFLVHWGRRLRTLFRRLRDRLSAPGLSPRTPEEAEGMPHILFVTSLTEAECGQTVRYRIFNVMEGLRGLSDTRFEILENGALRVDYAIRWADLIVLMRLEWSDEVSSIIGRARGYGRPVVFDVDDIVFLSEYTESFCRVIEDSSEKTFAYYRDFFGRFEKTFENCDFATASTEYIAEKMRARGKTAFVVHNGLNRRQLDIARRAGGGVSGRQRNRRRCIAYLSGSKTHDRDFRQALPAVVRILREYPDVTLRVAGYLDIPDFPPDLASRLEPALYMKYTRLMKYGAGNYINLAPLDLGNPFCHAKSELKYFEAAVVGVPTIASPTDTFVRCLRNYDNGILADGEDAWYTALRRLLDDGALYEQISASARRDALARYSPQAVAAEALAVYRQMLRLYRGGPEAKR